MKKLVCFCLVLVLVMSLSITAFADEIGVGVGDYSANITGSTVNSTTTGTVFSVDITWSDMNFIYHGEQAPVWDPENHTYTEGVAAYWEGYGSIVVANSSNIGITATPSYMAANGYEEADMIFSKEKLCVGTAEYGNQMSGGIEVRPTGSLPNDTQDKTIGTITITIAENAEISSADVGALRSAANSLVSKMEASELYDSNAELQTKARDLSYMTTDITEFSAHIATGNISSPSEIANRYNDFKARYYEYLAYFNSL